MTDLRIYQRRATDAIWSEFREGGLPALAVLPTGVGKTIVAAELASIARHEFGWRTLFLAHRDTLIRQARKAFREAEIPTATEMAAIDALAEATNGPPETRPWAILGSLASMQGERLYRWPKRHFGLIIVDECHHILSTSYANILTHFDDYRLCGLTATPDRGDQKNLGAIFGSVAFSYPLSVAIHGDDAMDPGGWLVEPRLRRLPIPIDLKSIKFSKGGDFNLGDLEERIGPKLEVIADAIRREHGGRQTVAFTPDVGSSQALADVLRQMEEADPIGATADWVAGEGGRFGMNRSIRDDRVRRFESGETRILINCELFFEGWDCPRIKCVVNARPTVMRYRFAQEVGRGLRPCPESGFDDCLVLDFDWQAGMASRSLATVIDLFDDGSMPEAVIRVAKAISDAMPEREDAMEMVEEAEELVRIRTKLKIRLTGRTAQYRAINMTPDGVSKILELGLVRKYDYDGTSKYGKQGGPVTEAQRYTLARKGVREPGVLSKWGASKIIGALERRDKLGLAGTDQVRELLAGGVDPEIARSLRKASASTCLEELRSLQAMSPLIQKELFT